MKLEVLLIGLGFYIAALVFALFIKRSQTKKPYEDFDEECTYRMTCCVAPRYSEDENWQIRVVFSTPIGTRCQYYVEIDSKANECEAVKRALEQAQNFLRNVRF